MTDNEIIKALECLMHDNCEDCPYYRDDCADRIKDPIELSKYAIDLINCYEAENKSLYKINAKSDEEISELRKELLKRQNLEESFLKTTKEFDKKLAKAVKLERAEAIKEFAERLKEIISKSVWQYWNEGGVDYCLAKDVHDDIDNLVKEMVGEEK